VIVGAGVCGAVMAILLAQRGIKVHIYERNADPSLSTTTTTATTGNEEQASSHTNQSPPKVNLVEPDTPETQPDDITDCDTDADDSAIVADQPQSPELNDQSHENTSSLNDMTSAVTEAESARLLAYASQSVASDSATQSLASAATAYSSVATDHHGSTATTQHYSTSTPPITRKQALNSRAPIEHTLVLTQRGIGVLELTGFPLATLTRLKWRVTHTGAGLFTQIRKKEISELNLWSVCRSHLVRVLVDHIRYASFSPNVFCMQF
jgi:hypothetical protein